MDHRGIIASLTVEQRRDLTRKSDAKGLWALAIHCGAIVLIGSVIATRATAYWPLLLPVQGILIIFLFTLLHETIHRTAFRTPLLNDCVAHVCGFLIGVQPEWFRYFHFAHHRHTQDPDKDPELATPKPDTWWRYVVHVSGIHIWRSGASTLFKNAFLGCGDEFVPATGRRKVVLEARVVLMLYFLLLASIVVFDLTVLLWVWIIPVVLGQPFLRLYLLAEHGRCPFVSNMLHNSRTTFTNALIRRLAWNMPYHAEHHAYPGVPFHQLPRFHDVVKPHLTEVEEGYSRFHANYVAKFSKESPNP